MSSPQNVIEGLYTKLTSDQSSGSLYDLVGGRIHHAQAPHNEDLPHLIYQIIGNPVDRYFGGQLGWQMVVRFEIWVDKDKGGAGSDGAGSIEEQLFDLLDTFELAVTGQDRGVILFTDRGVRSVIEDAILVESTADIRGVNT